MFRYYFSKRNTPFLLLDILLFLSSFYFLKESLGRFLVLLSFIIIYILISLFSKNRILSSIITIFLILPFNITYQLPSNIHIFSQDIKIYDEFVNGIIVNYLIPTLSILDVWCGILLFSFVFTKGKTFIKKALEKYYIILSILISFLLLHLFIIKEFIAFIVSLRILLFIILLILLIDIIKSSGKKFLEKYYKLFTILSLFNLLIQGFIAIQQFIKGYSLNLGMLGESQVVSGMRGSSFIILHEKIFLRGYGTFPHPNLLAGYLILIFFLSIFIFLRSKRCIRYLNSMNFVLCLFTMFLTFSRIGIFLILLSIILFLIYEVFFLRNMYVKRLSFENTKSYSFYIPFIYIYERFSDLLRGGDSSFTERMDLCKSAIHVWKDNLFLGGGVGMFIRSMRDFVPRSSKGIMILQPVHNIFLLMLAELGVLGFLIISFSIIILLFPIIKRNFNFYVFLILFNILIIGSFDHYFLTLPQGIVILFSLFILIVLDSYVLRNPKDSIKGS